MMTLVTGLPGRGKTLYAVQLVREAVTSGRKVYSDIEGLKIPHEVIPPPEEPWDWRDTPPGSLIVYDEAHRRFPSSGRAGPSPDEQVNRLDTHRHSGHDFVFITQYPGKLHKVIRDLVDRHCHMVRAFGLQGALIHEWGYCQASPESPTAKREADKVRWKFPRDLYKLYASASTHGRYNAFQLPGRAWMIPVGLIALAWLLWSIVSSFSARMSGGEKPAPAPVSGAVMARPAALSGPPLTLRGCITYRGGCRCIDDRGAAVSIDLMDCVTWSVNPFAIQPVNHPYTPPAAYVPPLGVIGATSISEHGGASTSADHSISSPSLFPAD